MCIRDRTWGEQTDVPESADWYNSSYIIAWGSNVPQTRTPDAHFFTEVRYKGTKTIAITPDYSEVAKLCDQWLAPKQGTDSALAMAMGHVCLLYTSMVINSTFMARLPLYVILLMISVTMVIKLMPVSALKEKRKSMIK